MKLKTLHRKKRKYFLFILLLCMAGMTKTYAYDFSAVCETGQTLYYNITDATNHYVELTCPLNYGWGNYTKPTGDIILPENIIYNGTTYLVTSIRYYAFNSCSDLTGCLTIPNSVTTIGNSAFYGCSGFTGSLTIGNSVTTIGNSAFYGCSGFTGSLIIPNSVTTIGNSAFHDCNGFTGNLIFGNSVTTIDDNAFRNCSGFTGSLTISNSVITIGSYAFKNCIGFTGTLAIGNSVTEIGNDAFYGCSGFTGNLIIPNSVTTISQFSFYNCSGFTGSLAIGNSVTMIGTYAFGYCGFTGSLTIGNSVIEIGNYAFFTCSGFTGSLTIPNSVTYIGTYAFGYCSSLTSIDIPNSVTSIGNMAFRYCDGLTSIAIPSSVTFIGTNPFSDCSNLAQIIVDSGNTAYDSRNNCNAIIKTNTSGLVTGCKNTVIPNTVVSIGNSAFLGCAELTSIVIPNSVTIINSNPFESCIGLEQIIVDSGNMVFDSREGCNAIIEISTNRLVCGCKNTVIPNSVTSIWDHAFHGCSNLTSISIPNSVTYIGYGAFCNCTGLTTMTVLAENPPVLSSIAYLEVPKNIPIYVPCASLFAYQVATGWNEFTNYIPIATCESGEITVTANPLEGGSVTGAGYYEGGTSCTLTATANPGYSFINWTENGNEVSTSEIHSFIVGGDASFVANFEQGLIVHKGNVTNGYVPIYGNYADAYLKSQAVYPASELSIMNGTDITKMSFYASQSNVSWGAANFQVFMTEVADSTISAFTSPGTVVYEGALSIIDGVMEVVFSNPYRYNGGNLLVSFYNTIRGSYVASTWYGENVPGSSVQGYGYTSLEAIAATQRNFLPKTLFLYNVGMVPETNLSAEICQGEDYLQNGFEIYYPEVGESLYSITLPSSQGLDSIVNLTLTVHPTYYIAEDTTLCNATSFQWHGNAYTQSGMYYDSLQTIHGCDSIYALSLEFFNTPLGEFTIMSPTNNYPFSSLPITFSWDAVSGAEYYDLYVWDEDEPMPNVPFVSNLTGRNFSTTALLNYHTYNWFVTARNACYETSSTVKSFYLDIEPSLSVNLNQIDFGEVTFNQSVSTPMSVSGVVLEDTLNVQIVGDDAAMFSFTKASGWNDYTGGFLIVTFHPTVPQYSYNANLVISSGTLTTTTSLTGGLADMFVFNTYVAEDVYAMNSPIPIYGSLTDVSSIPVANAEVEIGVFVMGMKRTLQAVTNESGQFSAVFEPMPSESGYYTVNSGRVGNHSTAVHDDFNIPGITLVSSDYILCAVTQDQPKTDSILIRNKSNLNISNIQVSPISVPDGASFSFMPLSLSGLEENWLVYTVTGSTLTQGNYYEEAKLKAMSSEGAETNLSIWYYCMEPRGVLDVMPKSLATTMTKGKSKIVDVMLTNNGTAATGNITIDLPDVEWMSVVGNDTLSSIAVNDTAYFSLRFSPAEDIQLGQYSGTIAINSERGDAVALPYTITAVSDSTGTLMIDVTDDFTWNTNNGNGPHLEGAEVTLKGYYSLETVAYGFTDADGHFSVEDLPEGYYRLSVTAERHTDYNSIVFIEAGATGRSYTNVYLQYQAVTYSWIVEPTEIEDEYTYELVVNYETNVPVPVITIEHSGIHLLEYGESANFNLIITNHGLISAFDTHIYFSESNEYIFTPLYDVIDTLQALSTYVVPGTYTRINNSLKSNDEDCDLHVRTISIYYCNRNGTWTSLIENYSPPFFGQYTVCHTHSDNDYGSGVLILNGGDGDGRLVNHHFGQGQPIVTNNQVCSSCLNELAKSLVGCLAKPLECMLFNGAYDYLTNSSFSDAYINQIMCAISALIEQLGSGGLSCLIGTCYNLSRCINIQFNDVTRDNVDFIQNTIDNLYFSSLYYANELSIAKSFFAEESWDYEENIVEFFDQVKNIMDVTTGFIEESDAHQLASTFVGTSASYDDIIAFINRWNRSLEYWSNGYFMLSDLPEGYNTDFVQIDADLTNEMLDIEDYYSQLGYEDMADVYSESLENANTIIGNASQSSVCAHVTVKFSQKMTMTREAFDGTLTIYNGHPTEPIEAINVNFVIKDSAGNDCTSLFQINTLSLNNITGIDGTGSIGGGMDGIAKIQFIPTRLAAPTMPKVYYFGGSFSFIDPYTGEEIYYDLYPVEITVNPSPDLYVDYFMQRDILGDDALTLDVVEPSVPAELGVIINNKGAGMAKNVLLETAEPQIIDNEKGLAIDFAMYGASFNGSPRQLGLMGISFGNIESGQTAVGEWLFTSSLLGHFVSYEAHVIHNSSYGNPDLSLVSHLDIHELIHPIYAYGNLDDGINDFLVNDNPDAYDTPDSIYFSHGGKTSVGVVDNISFDHYVSPSDTIVTLTVEPSRIGWNYGVTDDPGMNQYNIVSCIRNNDNQDIPLNNVWLTFVTIPDGGDPVYENKLHIVDTIPVEQTTTYTLVFARKPSNLRIFHGNEDEYWSNAANWEGNIIPQADDEVLINGICQLDEDVEVFSLTVAENQSLTIPEDRILTVSGMLTSASVSRLIIEEGGQLFHGNTGVQATVQKTIMPYTEGQSDGWYLIAPPLAGITPVTSVTNLLSNTYDLYYYDEPTHYWMNQKYAPNNFTDLVNGKGYLYANSGEVLLEFPGELKNGSSSVCVLLNYTENIDLKGFNFVGNPFVYNLTSYASVNVANGCYQMNETKDDLVVSEISEENPLKPAEGFFVKALGEGASVTFNPGRGEMANHSGSIRVELLDEGKLIDRLIVKIEGEPLEKMSLKEQRTKLFAMQDHQEIAIVPCEGNEQPVNFKAAKDGTYTINVNTKNLDFNYLHLIDNLTGVDVDLLALRQAQGPMSYTFEAKTTDYASRFRLVFSVCGDADDDDAPFAFINNGDIIIIGAEAGAVLQIVDVLGHVVRSGDAMNRVSTGGMAKGVYVLRLIEGEKVRTQKIVID